MGKASIQLSCKGKCGWGNQAFGVEVMQLLSGTIAKRKEEDSAWQGWEVSHISTFQPSLWGRAGDSVREAVIV